MPLPGGGRAVHAAATLLALVGVAAVVGSGISGDGLRLLVTEGGLDGPASTGNILAVPFTGGAPTRLVAHAAEPSWNE